MKRGVCFGLVLCCSFLLAGLSAEAAKPVPPSLVRVLDVDAKTVNEMTDGDFDVAKVGQGYVEVVCADGNHKAFLKKGNKVEVLIPDLDEYVRQVLLKSKEGEQYYSFDTMTAQLQKWAQDYKHIARLESIGKSHEGRDIWGLKVSDQPDLDEPEPAVLIMGLHHAREWITIEVPMATIKQLLESYGTDERLTRLVNEREIWFVPMVNPDGLVYSQTQSKYWRKNRRKMGSTYGVDPNRNYSWHWSESGSSSSSSSDTFHGPSPLSEPETQAIAKLAQRERFQASTSFHSYSELILYPWSWASNIPCDDHPTLRKLAVEMAEFNSYRPIVSAELYPAAGDTDDYLYGELKVLSFTFELATTFIPAPSQIANINKQNVPAMLHLIEKAGPYAVTTPSGDVALLSQLDFADTKAAVEHAQAILSTMAPDAGAIVADRLAKAEERLSELVAKDLSTGSTARLDELKAPAFAKVRENVNKRVLFSTSHRETVR